MASTSSFTASSSASPSIPPKSYDVFLSFRGEDTRYNFTDHLYNALVNRGIRTFRDDKLKRGEAIAPELLKIIEESRSSIIVFSENYAHSRWCLDELVKIMECKKELEHAVFPIFYHVDPSHVRHQNGSFGKAFAGYEENWKEKVERWRTALTEAANLSGWRLLDGYESNHIKEMTNVIFHRLNCKRLDVGANLVGINYRIEKMIWRLHMVSSDVRIVGIYGVGGIGKTTIAKVLYNRLSCEFEYMSFLENIREVISNTQGLLQLQNQLLGDILDGVGSQNNINNVCLGANMIRSILSSKRVFVVLDDVDDSDQLEYLLGHRAWLGQGSRVIITTRNKHLLDGQEVDDLYDVEGLYFQEAYQLFSLYAFKQNLPKSDFINLSKHVVYYCQGLPLALKVLGSHLFKKTISEWESELHKLGREPEAKIHNVLKRSYDGLDRGEKNIFLDVACFFKDEDRNFVSRILDGCNFHVERGIRNLNDKCLITVPYNQIHMHDLIQQMGWEIVREKFPDEPNKWSRLWDPHDIERAFRTYEGIKRVETISLDLSNLKRVHFNSNVFAKMTRLRLLRVHSGSYKYHDDEDIERREDIEGEKHYDVVLKNVSKMQFSPNFKFPSNELRYLRWDGYPLDFLPSNFDGEKLVELHLKCSNIKQLWQGKKDLERLKVIDLSYSKKLIQMPEFSSMSNLERLILRGCVNLIDIHPSVGVLRKLTTLNLKCCNKLKGFPSSISNWESLEILDLSQCSSFEKFPEIQGSMRSLWRLFLKGTAIRELPSSIDLESVERLNLDNCSKFEKFPENGANMKSLWKLHLANTAIKELPRGIAHWESLPTLDLSYCSKFEKFPENAGNMKSLKWLYLKNTAIKDLPDTIGDLESVEILDLSHCSKFEKFPEKGGNMKSLKDLQLQGTAIKDLPDSIGDLESLRILDLSYCSKFEKFPEIERSMKHLFELNLRGTAIDELPSSLVDNLSGLWLDIGECKNLRSLPDNIYKFKLLQIGGWNGRGKEDDTSLLWLCHLKWLESATDELKCWKLGAVYPESSGIPEWIRHQNLGKEVKTELPMNWYEDSDLLGFVVSCVHQPSPTFDVFGYNFVGVNCQLKLHGNGFLFEDRLWCLLHDNFNDCMGRVCVWWYPKTAIPKEHHHKFTHFNASFWEESGIFDNTDHVKKCGVNLIFAGDQHNHMPKLSDHRWNSGDNGSALQDTNGSGPMLLDLLGNFGDSGSVVLEESNGNRKRSRDDSLPHAVEEPQYKRLAASPNTNPSL